MGSLFDDLIDSRNLAWNVPKMARPSVSRTAEPSGFPNLTFPYDPRIVKFSGERNARSCIDRIEIIRIRLRKSCKILSKYFFNRIAQNKIVERRF